MLCHDNDYNEESDEHKKASINYLKIAQKWFNNGSSWTQYYNHYYEHILLAFLGLACRQNGTNDKQYDQGRGVLFFSSFRYLKTILHNFLLFIFRCFVRNTFDLIIFGWKVCFYFVLCLYSTIKRGFASKIIFLEQNHYHINVFFSLLVKNVF